MPIYEYRCTDCDHRVEKLQRMADDPLKDCPECNRPALKRLVSAAAFKLKGSGWYETDFKGKDKASSEHTKASDSSGKDSKSEKVNSKATKKDGDKSSTKNPTLSTKTSQK
ncbi:MAG: putative FmdB family regulatory protein [Polaribacter sp.]|jgi:putative FmdB family regulatory protein